MKTFIITCFDKKNSLKTRLANRELHLTYLKSFKNKLILAGPILNKRNKPKGSVLILKFKNKFELNNFLKNDPYSKVGLFDTINIEILKRVF